MFVCLKLSVIFSILNCFGQFVNIRTFNHDINSNEVKTHISHCSRISITIFFPWIYRVVICGDGGIKKLPLAQMLIKIIVTVYFFIFIFFLHQQITQRMYEVYDIKGRLTNVFATLS